MENLHRWQSSRKAYRAHLTKLHRTVTEIMDSSETPGELDDKIADTERRRVRKRRI